MLAVVVLCGFFFLEPAVAQAACNETLILQFYDSLDANGDGNISRSETDSYIISLDANYDGSVSIEEAEERIVLVDPRFKDDVRTIFPVLDVDKDGLITGEDEDILFDVIDTDGDGTKSTSEYTKYVTEQCRPDEPEVYYK